MLAGWLLSWLASSTLRGGFCWEKSRASDRAEATLEEKMALKVKCCACMHIWAVQLAEKGAADC